MDQFTTACLKNLAVRLIGRVRKIAGISGLALGLILAGCNLSSAPAPAPTPSIVTSPTYPTKAPALPSATLPPPPSTPTTEILLPPGTAIGLPAPLSDIGQLYALVGVAPDSSLDMHSQPGAASAIMTAIPADAVNLEILAESQQDAAGVLWAPVAYQGLTGWVKQANLARQAGAPTASLARSAMQAIQAIKRQDFPALSSWVDPQRGVRFSPYANIQAEDLIFSQSEIYYVQAESKNFAWGTQDGSGEALVLSFPEYYQKFIYDVDFAQPEAIGFNVPLSSGSRINNLAEFYPGAAVVEYYFSGFDPQFAGLDWRSLRLVFAPGASGWSLVGIVHDEWGP